MEGSQIALTTRFKYLLLKIKKYSLFEKLMKENILSLVFFRSKKYLDLSKISSVSGWQLRLLKHCWSRDINSNISLALCLQPRRYRRGLTDSMKASPPAWLQQVHLPLQTLLEVKARQRECSRRVPGCPSCGGWNWTPTDHLTRQLPGLKDCLGLQTAGDGAQATPAGIGLQEDYVDMGNDR